MHPLSEIITNTKKLNQFASKGIYTAEDLVRYFPRKYMDYTRITTLPKYTKEEVTEGAFKITAHSISDGMSKNKTPYLCVTGIDAVSGAKVSIYWFNQSMSKNYISAVLPGEDYFVAGKATFLPIFKGYTIAAPSIFLMYDDSCCGIYPVYSRITGMSEEYLRASIRKCMECYDADDPYPEWYARKLRLPQKKEAVEELHAPKSAERLKRAQTKMIFDTLLRFCVQTKREGGSATEETTYRVTNLKYTKALLESLPYELTEDQKAIVKAVIEQMKAGTLVNCLIQGDVGSGKSIVAFALMLAMVSSGYQCALMAPSKVLAQQHYNDLKKITDPLGINVALCVNTSTMKRAEQRAFYEGIENGTTDIVIGTHALTSDKINFKNLALVITDEEHKFGVIQRNVMREKTKGIHTITMSATPIPRSLAQVIYGDHVKLYTITTMPSGRKPVITKALSDHETVFKAVESQLKIGHQAFVVCPMIENSEKTEGIASVKEITKAYTKYFVSRGYYIETLTGKTSKEETEKIIGEFKTGKINILIATTVVEVGVNIPNASVIVIHNAERFGLASLHQLRGRVGRSDTQSYCILVSPDAENKRLETMENTNSGFEIARADLEMRGPGEWLGTEQSGFGSLEIQMMLAYPEIYKFAQKQADYLLAEHSSWEIVSGTRE